MAAKAELTVAAIVVNIQDSAKVSATVQQAQHDASTDPTLPRAGHLPKLAWEHPLTAN